MKKFFSIFSLLTFVCSYTINVQAVENKKYIIDEINFNSSKIISYQDQSIKLAATVNVGDEEINKAKNPLISAGLSFVIPGAGQIYNEEYLKGALLFVGVLGLAYLDFFIIEPTAKANNALPEAQRKNNSLFDLGALFVRIGLPSLWAYNWGSAYQYADPVYQRKLQEERKKKEKEENPPLSNNIFNIKLVKVNF